MTNSLSVQVALSQSAIPASTYLDEPLYAVLDIQPPATAPTETSRSPLNIVLVVDSSGTMHHFQLTEDEREYWMGLAISRDEMERGHADASDAVYWTGQTLSEMQTVARKPMAFAVEAIKQVLSTLLPTDSVSVVAFADHVHTVFSAQEWQTFHDHCMAQLDLLRERRLSVDIGDGTFMAEALRTASDLLKASSQTSTVNRLIVISDGIVQDPEVTIVNVTAIQEDGIAISTVGVGDEFDEEFLTRIADNSRGQYHYASDIGQLTECLTQELSVLETTSVTDLYLAIRGLEGAVVQDIFQVRPSMTLYDEVFTEEGWMRARLGDISSVAPASVLIQIAPPTLSEGTHGVAEAQLTWSHSAADGSLAPGTVKTVINVEATDDPAKLNQMQPDVADLVARFSVFKYEREAQRAQERGDLDRAKEKLGAATRQLQKLGETALAQDMEEQITALGKAETDPTRVKRIKATTRRLGTPVETSAHS